MGTRDFQIFVARYADKPNGKFMNIAVCMSGISNGGSRFLVQERLEDCSSNIDVSVSRRTLKPAEPDEEMRKLVQVHLR
jgi:hypothetical protein